MWFTGFHANAIGRITMQGVVTVETLPSGNVGPFDIASAPDGTMWFSEGSVSRIGRIGSGMQPPPSPAPSLAPAITSFSPASGPPGTAVAVGGSNFAGATSVRFNGTVQPSFTVDPTGTLITTTVPAGATSGPIMVTSSVGTAVSAGRFTVVGLPTAHVRNVTLRLSRHLRAHGRVVVADAFSPCAEARRVRIQLSDGGTWKTVSVGRTDSEGRYSVALPDRPGWYRARIGLVMLDGGDVCNEATSGTRHHSA
jgi:hypothetical protein